MVHPKKHVVQAVAFAPGRTTWKVLDPSVKDDFDGHRQAARRRLRRRSTATRTTRPGWSPSPPTAGRPLLRLGPRSRRRGVPVRPPAEAGGAEAGPDEAGRDQGRDGLTLHAYLTLPAGVEAKNLPMVLLVHGGPWARDSWGFNPMAQWLANRGYAVLQVNFRGSTGFGKKFLNAGNREWGRQDARRPDRRRRLGRQARASPTRRRWRSWAAATAATRRWSALTFTPDVFACGVDIVGPSNLVTLLEIDPAVLGADAGHVRHPRWATSTTRRTPSCSRTPRRCSRPTRSDPAAADRPGRQRPARQAGRVGADRRGDREEQAGRSPTCSSPTRATASPGPRTAIDFNARAEAFLAEHLGGRYEPMPGDKYPGSTAVVKVIGG